MEFVNHCLPWKILGELTPTGIFNVSNFRSFLVGQSTLQTHVFVQALFLLCEMLTSPAAPWEFRSARSSACPAGILHVLRLLSLLLSSFQILLPLFFLLFFLLLSLFVSFFFKNHFTVSLVEYEKEQI